MKALNEKLHILVDWKGCNICCKINNDTHWGPLEKRTSKQCRIFGDWHTARGLFMFHKLSENRFPT